MTAVPTFVNPPAPKADVRPTFQVVGSPEWQDLHDNFDPLLSDMSDLPCGIKRHWHHAGKVHLAYLPCKKWDCRHCDQGKRESWLFHLETVTGVLEGAQLWLVTREPGSDWNAYISNIRKLARAAKALQPNHAAIVRQNGTTDVVFNAPVPGARPLTRTGLRNLLMSPGTKENPQSISRIRTSRPWAKSSAGVPKGVIVLKGPVPTPDEMSQAAQMVAKRPIVVREVDDRDAWWHVQADNSDLEGYLAALEVILARRNEE